MLTTIEDAVLQDMTVVVFSAAFLGVLFALLVWKGLGGLAELLTMLFVWIARMLGRRAARRRTHVEVSRAL